MDDLPPLPRNVSPEEFENILNWIDRLANFYDSRWRIGPISFGFDSVLGLIPGISAANTVMSSLLVAQGSRIIPSSHLRRKLWSRVVIDFVINLIPGLGPILNVMYKANRRNANDILQFYHRQPMIRSREERNISVLQTLRNNLPEMLHPRPTTVPLTTTVPVEPVPPSVVMDHDHSYDGKGNGGTAL